MNIEKTVYELLKIRQQLQDFFAGARTLDTGSILESIDIALNSLEYSELPSEHYQFHFRSSGNRNQKLPYVAEITVSPTGRINREFVDLPREFGEDTVTVHGMFIAREGDILEMRHANPKVDDFRHFYVVYEGELVKLGKYNNAALKIKIIQYLQRTIDVKAFKAIAEIIEDP